MKRTVLFTAGITLAAAIITMVCIYFIIALVSPVSAADFWDGLGAYSLSVKYYEKQYDKTGNPEDLSVLCLKLDEYDDSETAAFYLKIFTESEDFIVICEKEDLKTERKIGAYDYYYGKYAVAEYFDKGVNAAIAVAQVSQNAGYTRYNPYYVLLNDEKLGISEEERAAVTVAAEEYVSTFPEDEQAKIRQDLGL